MHPQGFWVLSLFLGAATGAAVSDGSVLRCGAARASRVVVRHRRGFCREPVREEAAREVLAPAPRWLGAGFAGRWHGCPVPSLPSSRELPNWLGASPAVPSALAALQVPRTQPAGAAPGCQHSPHEHPAPCGAQPRGASPPALGWAPVPGTTFLPAPVTARCLCSAAQRRRSRGSPGQVREILFGSQGIRVENLSDSPEMSPRPRRCPLSRAPCWLPPPRSPEAPPGRLS